MAMQFKRWVNTTELMQLFGVKTRRSVQLWREKGLPAHHVLGGAGVPPRCAFDIIEVMQWAQRIGKALPLSVPRHVKGVQERERMGKRLSSDDIVTSIVRGDLNKAPQGMRVRSV
jgi:hypothetical protein